MCIKPEKVNRDENGFWTHSQWPDFDGAEYPTNEQVDKWLKENKIGIRSFWFENDADEELNERWFEKNDLTACAEWNPVCESEGAFLISIHDTEDGPIAVFAIPNKK